MISINHEGVEYLFSTLEDVPVSLSEYVKSDSYEVLEFEEEEDLSPNSLSFKTNLISTESWVQWCSKIPSFLYTHLTVAASTDSWGEVQKIYDRIKTIYPLSEQDQKDWQTLADNCNIPLVF